MCELMKQQETHLKQQVSYLVCVCSAWSFLFSLPPSAGNNLNFLNVKNTGRIALEYDICVPA